MNSQGSSMSKMADDPEQDLKIPTVTHSFKVALMKARQAKKLTQAQLAQQLNVKPQIINDYESGKAIPNGQLIANINRILDTKLPKIPKKTKSAGDDE
jgi:putative transcription factor